MSDDGNNAPPGENKSKPPSTEGISEKITFEFEDLDGTIRIEELNLNDGWLVAGATGGCGCGSSASSASSK